MKYVAYDYEEPGAPDNFWHIYTIDTDDGELRDQNTLVTIKGPYTFAMRAAVEAICMAIDSAVDTAKAETAKSKKEPPPEGDGR